MAVSEAIKAAKLDQQKIRIRLGLRGNKPTLTPGLVNKIIIEYTKLYPKKLDGKKFHHKYNVAQQFAVAHVVHELTQSDLRLTTREKTTVRQFLNQAYTGGAAEEIDAATKLSQFPNNRGEQIYANIVKVAAFLKNMFEEGSNYPRPSVPKERVNEDAMKYLSRLMRKDHGGDMFINQFSEICSFPTLSSYKEFLSKLTH